MNDMGFDFRVVKDLFREFDHGIAIWRHGVRIGALAIPVAFPPMCPTHP
jgi:hypothetical protein